LARPLTLEVALASLYQSIAVQSIVGDVKGPSFIGLPKLFDDVNQDVEEYVELGDAATSDLLTEISRGLDKWLWLVEAHEQNGQRRRSDR
jgi:DNA-binding ferritin-like protein